MHRLVLITFHEVGRPAVSDKECFQFSMADTRKDCRVVDLVAVKMEDREDGAIGDGVEKLGTRLALTLTCSYTGHTLLLCQLVARGPVSLSPSPTMVKAMRSGLSKTAPKACDME